MEWKQPVEDYIMATILKNSTLKEITSYIIKKTKTNFYRKSINTKRSYHNTLCVPKIITNDRKSTQNLFTHSSTHKFKLYSKKHHYLIHNLLFQL